MTVDPLKLKSLLFCRHTQGSHRLEKYLNLVGFLEKSLKIKSALKNTGNSLKNLEKSSNCTISVRFSTVDRELIQYKIMCLCLVQHMLHQIYRHNNFILIFQY